MFPRDKDHASRSYGTIAGYENIHIWSWLEAWAKRAPTRWDAPGSGLREPALWVSGSGPQFLRDSLTESLRLRSCRHNGDLSLDGFYSVLARPR